MKFLFSHTEFQGLVIIEPQVFSDARGYFSETFNSKEFLIHKNEYFFVQDNESHSSYGVLRGLHFQFGNNAQAKLVRVVYGEVIDVVVDLRPDSKTFLRHYNIILSASNKKQLLIPRGFAHGFCVLSETAIFSYKCDNYYSPASEGGIHPLDPELNIQWGIPETELIISAKDLALPMLSEYLKNAH
ncbi:MAG: dTDP-4-dehydrorhamnose 3,5-epimerase [Saprospiraceae bacterium]|nr:dTDP-4-dehydrorhamnose 3,5-epimerase [Saprospiraceae bacterium]